MSYIGSQPLLVHKVSITGSEIAFKVAFVNGLIFIEVDLLEIGKAKEVFDHHLHEACDASISVADVAGIVTNLSRHLAEGKTELHVPLINDLIINWLLNVYDQ